MTNLSDIANKKILITGASGLIGRALCEVALSLGATVIGAGRSRAKFVALEKDSHFRFMSYEATGVFACEDTPDIIVHAASAASPNLYTSQPVETMLANICGINEILRFAKDHPCKVIYVSSSEVYGKAEPREDGFKEEDSGYVDILSPRSSYPMGKRAAETLCAAYAAEYGVDVSIVRPGHIYGPTASESDGRVSSLWPRVAARGEDIVMKSSGAQIRSYTYAKDCATAILTVALRGKKGEAYNIANPNVACSIRELAETIAACGGIELKMEHPTGAEAAAFNPMNNSRLDADKLVELGWCAEYDVTHGVRETIDSLRRGLND